MSKGSVALIALVGLLACKDEPAPTLPPATAAPTAAAATAPTAAPQTPPAADVEGLKQALKCGPAGHGPCRVLAELTACEDFDPVTSSGDGRWMGKGQVVRDGAFHDEITILRSRRVPTGEVGPGQLGAKIAIGSIPEARAHEIREAERAINSYSRGDVPRASNAAIVFLKGLDDWSEAFSAKAEQNQIYAANQGGAWLCAKQDQRLLLVHLVGNRTHKADGVYATLYPVSW
jgi:hypothetical protein